MQNFVFHSNDINHDRLLLMITNEKFVVYVMILNLFKDVHELELVRLHPCQGKTWTIYLKNCFLTIEYPWSYARQRSVSPVRSSSPVRSLSPTRALVSTDSTLQKVREDTLIQRFNELYTRDRLNAMDILRTVSTDYDMNQRICYNIVQVKINSLSYVFVWRRSIEIF